MDSRISQETSRGDENYSAIPENVFFTPLKHSTQNVRSVFQSLSTLPAGTRPQLQSTPQEPGHLPRLNMYAKVPEEFPRDGSPRPAYDNQSLRQPSPSVRKSNFLYASYRAVPGRSPFVNSVKVDRNPFSINKLGLPNTSREIPAEEKIVVGNNSRQLYTTQENSEYVYETGPCSEANICVI